MEDDFTQFHDSSPRCVESYRYKNDGFHELFCYLLQAPDWLILTLQLRGSSSGLKFIYKPETRKFCFTLVSVSTKPIVFTLIVQDIVLVNMVVIWSSAALFWNSASQSSIMVLRVSNWVNGRLFIAIALYRARAGL